MRNLLIPALALAFALVGFVAYQNALPQEKNQRIYSELKPYIPYKLEKRFGGLSIVSTLSDVKEKPPASEVMKRLDQLEQMWGKEHLELKGNDLIVYDDNRKVLKTIKLQTQDEKIFVKSFFGL